MIDHTSWIMLLMMRMMSHLWTTRSMRFIRPLTLVDILVETLVHLVIVRIKVKLKAMVKAMVKAKDKDKTTDKVKGKLTKKVAKIVKSDNNIKLNDFDNFSRNFWDHPKIIHSGAAQS